jgi:deoxyhypusine synthase
MAGKTSVPAAAHDAVLRTSATGEDHGERVSGYDFNHGLDLQALLRSMHSTGFQASHLGQAVEEVNRMVSKWNGSPIFKTARTLGASEFSSEEFRATNQPFGLRHCEDRM